MKKVFAPALVVATLLPAAPAQQALSIAGTVGELELDKAAGTATPSRPLAVAQVLRLTSGTRATGGNLTLLSTAARQAYAVHAGGLTTGAVAVPRYVPGPTAATRARC